MEGIGAMSQQPKIQLRQQPVVFPESPQNRDQVTHVHHIAYTSDIVGAIIHTDFTVLAFSDAV